MATRKRAEQDTIPLQPKGGGGIDSSSTPTAPVAVVEREQKSGGLEAQKAVGSSEITAHLGGLVGNPLATGEQTIADSYGSLAYLQGENVPSLSASQADNLIGENDGKSNYLRVVQSNNNLVVQGIKTAQSFVKVEEAAWNYGGAVVAAKEAKAQTLHKEEMHGLNNTYRSTVQETAGYRNQRAATVRDKAKARVQTREDVKF
jgi:hypothetical protein